MVCGMKINKTTTAAAVTKTGAIEQEGKYLEQEQARTETIIKTKDKRKTKWVN